MAGSIDAYPTIAFSRGNFCINRSGCDPMAWRLERINPSSRVTCKNQPNAKLVLVKVV
jgi:hypothetical protein